MVHGAAGPPWGARHLRADGMMLGSGFRCEGFTHRTTRIRALQVRA